MSEIEEKFKNFLNRPEISIILINQHVSVGLRKKKILDLRCFFQFIDKCCIVF